MGVSAFHYGAHAPQKMDGNKPRFLFDGIDVPSFTRLQIILIPGGTDTARNVTWRWTPCLICARSIRPILWKERRQPDSERVASLFDEARQHGLAAGMALSTHGSNNEHSVFSLAIDNTRQREQRDLARQIGSAYLLLVHMHEAVRRLAFPKEPASAEVSLTARERESLLWVIDGKTSWEIAQVHNISENTVILHINNANESLMRTAGRRAAAKARALGLIKP